jgi:hypothetical protein
LNSAEHLRVVPLLAPLPTHPLLVEALRRVQAKERRRPWEVMRTLTRGLRAEIADNLVNAAWSTGPNTVWLGLFPLRYLPGRDVAYVSALKEHVAAVLIEAEPDERTCTLISLLCSFKAFDQSPRRTELAGNQVSSMATG